LFTAAHDAKILPQPVGQRLSKPGAFLEKHETVEVVKFACIFNGSMKCFLKFKRKENYDQTDSRRIPQLDPAHRRDRRRGGD
jgi:hypothetical protein